MRSVRWALLVLLGSCLLQPALSGPHAHNQAVKDRRWKDQLRGLKDYEIVVPQRINTRGRLYPSNNHYLPRQKRDVPFSPPKQSKHRKKRSTPADSDPFQDHKEDDFRDTSNHEMFYQIHTKDTNLTLHLVPQLDLLSKHVVIQYMEGNYTWRSNVSEVVDRGCFHSGYVVQDPGSVVHVSLCHSLMGTIRTGDQIYFIEPHPDARNQYDLDQDQPVPPIEPSVNQNAADKRFLLSRKSHIMYTLSDVHHFAKKTKHCPLKGHHKHERWKRPEESRILNQTATFSTPSSVASVPSRQSSARATPSSVASVPSRQSSARATPSSVASVPSRQSFARATPSSVASVPSRQSFASMPYASAPVDTAFSSSSSSAAVSLPKLGRSGEQSSTDTLVSFLESSAVIGKPEDKETVFRRSVSTFRSTLNMLKSPLSNARLLRSRLMSNLTVSSALESQTSSSNRVLYDWSPSLSSSLPDPSLTVSQSQLQSHDSPSLPDPDEVYSFSHSSSSISSQVAASDSRSSQKLAARSVTSLRRRRKRAVMRNSYFKRTAQSHEIDIAREEKISLSENNDNIQHRRKHSRRKHESPKGERTEDNIRSRKRRHKNDGDFKRGKRHSRKGNNFPPHMGEYVEDMVQRHVEALLVVDKTMYDYHRDDLEHYVLTLMAVVRSIYHDPSIGEPIDIAVVKIIVLRDEKHGPSSISGNAIQTLKAFCEWQHQTNMPEHDHTHHDTAVLLTRQDLCRSAIKCDTLGLAELGTMCTPRKSCSIIEDNGLSSAFTVAHELGHVFSLPHDEQDVCAKYHSTDDKSHMKAMARRLDHTMHPWTWSECSRGYMNEFIDSGHAECLIDAPGDEVDMSDVQVAGEEYDADHQCRQLFGDNFGECSYFYPKCQRLWCQSKTDKTCITQHMPWADGSRCAPGAWCQRGVCTPKRITLPTHGGWSAWTRYSNCTWPCDGGVQVSERYCNYPEPKHGGTFCTGPKRKYRSCNIQVCPKGTTDFRVSQCAAYNGNWYNINGLDHTVKWLPKYAGVADDERCKLICQANGTAAFYPLNRKVIDGTKCGQTTSDVCINGLCVRAGCDNILNSTLRRDWCGICGGDNTQCTNISSEYIPDRVVYGYNYVVTLPKGVFNVRILQVSSEEDDNYLAVRTKSRKYLLNGNFSIRLFEKAIMLKDGGQLEYTGSRTKHEMIHGTKPLPENLYIEVLSVGTLRPPVIYYNYTQYLVSSAQTAPHPVTERYAWRYHKRWSKCSMICNGQKKKSAVCVRERDLQVVDDEYCVSHKPVPKVKRCQKYCRLRWTKVDQGMCSARCGLGTARVRWRCERQWTRKRRIKYTADKHCYLMQPKPSGQEVCRGLCRPTHWDYTSWSKCSETCGGGEQVAQAICLDDMGNVWKNRECQKETKIVKRVCNDTPCPQWVASEWGQCDCGVRKQTRHIWCMLDRKSVSKRSCDPGEEPSRQRNCVSSSNCAQWITGTWGQCYSMYKTCMRSRTVKCRSPDRVFLDNEKCDANSRPSGIDKCPPHKCVLTTRPTTTTTPAPTTTTTVTTTLPTTTTPQPTTTTTRRTTRMTTTTTAPTTTTTRPPATRKTVITVRADTRYSRWRTGSWAQCSATCGPGTRGRYVSCRDLVGRRMDDANCVQQPKPPSVETCNVHSCGTWRTGEWSMCSRTCGDGVASRLVACVSLEDLEHQRESPVYCDKNVQPTQEKLCNHGDCVQEKDYDVISISTNRVEQTAHWRVGPWGACSKSCEGGTHLRRVVCQDETGDSNDCDPDSEPEDQESCNTEPCPSWRTGGWTQCSVSCGRGEQQRMVSCLLPNNTVLHDAQCDIDHRPDSVQNCNMFVCPKRRDLRWQKDDWSQCSVSCGQGHRTRKTMCVDSEGNHYPNHLCAGRKPRNTKLCKRGRCPQWWANRWSQCSATCGAGLKTRELRCVGSEKQELNETLCEHLAVPNKTVACRVRKCTRFFWRNSHWSKCSTPCGQGVSSRRVACLHMSSRRPVHPRYCSQLYKPRSRRRCLNAPCRHMWVAGGWRQCSEQCGDGRQQRNVSCRAISREGWLSQREVDQCKPADSPVSERLCNHGDCDDTQHWQVSDWSKCSVSCGFGHQRRIVKCVDQMGNDSPRRNCLQLFQPDSVQMCYLTHCHAGSCKELKKVAAVHEDGEYRLLIHNHIRSIYCAKMESDRPKEYLTLATEDDNYAYVHGRRLQMSATCPSNDKRVGMNCSDCYRENSFHKAGRTTFSRVRLNITTLAVIGIDFTFSTTHHGRKIPFATAGDCYSSLQKCPQGSFGVNLSNTGFKVAMNNTWNNSGFQTISSVSIQQGGEMVVGSCGGHCGICSPNGSAGLHLEIQP